MTATPSGHLVCPACGVAVVPGYVRCPKCHAGLPYGSGRTKRTTVDPGGTSMAAIKPPAGFPVLAIVAAVVVAGGIVAAISWRASRSSSPPPVPTTSATPISPLPPVAPRPASEVVIPVGPPPPGSTAPAPSPDAVAADLDHALKHERLWATVQARAGRLEIRSALCNEAGMTAVVGRAHAALKAAGLTRWKCIEESGQPVFERDL